MARERIITGASMDVEEEQYNLSLRPGSLEECIGSPELMEKISIALAAARKRSEPMEHTLLHGPPGLGKTTMAHVVANEMGTTLHVTSGPALMRGSDLMGILTNMERADVLFIDEIHRLPKPVQEFIYPAIEDFRVDFSVDSGPHARTIRLPLKPFTLIGATTRSGLLSAPLLSRFGIAAHLEFWSDADLAARAERTATLLNVPFDADALHMIAARSRGTPRIVNRLLRRVRDYAEVRLDGRLTARAVTEALRLEGVDELGMDELDRNFLRTLITVYKGGPAGIEALAATLSEERDTLEDVVEPYLLRIGFVARTSKGRVATDAAYRHLGMEIPDDGHGADDADDDPTLFDQA